MKEDHQQLLFICKFCSKRFPCGKSLGGHIRSHLASKSNSSESDEKQVGFGGVEAALKGSKTSEFSNGQSSYVLRENPTRTWKTADSNSKSNSRICKQCGKSFQSQKALCGHMACHSEKEKNPKAADDDDYYDDDEEEDDEGDDDSWGSEKGEKRVFFDAHSDTESEDLAIRTRCNKNPKKIDGPNYSSVTEIDGDERADLAKSLMKLSRDKSGYADVIETKKRGSAKIENGRSIRKANLDISDEDTDQSSDSSGYFLEEYGGESEASSDRLSREYHSAAIASYFAGFDSKKKRPVTRNEINHRETACDDSPAKKSKYECFNCKKTFKSYQALGGHRPCHKRMISNSSASELRLEAGENVPEGSKEAAANANANGNKIAASGGGGGGNRSGLVVERKEKGKKGGGNKGHVCPFCDRVFKNGQALGGHKRSHFLGGGGSNNEGSGSGSHVREVVKPRLLDLNLPAPKEEGVEEGGDDDEDDEDDDDDDGDEDGGDGDEEEQEEEEEVEEEGDDQSLTWR